MIFPQKKVMPRYFIVTVVMVLLGVAVVAKAVYTMTVKRDYWLEVKASQVRLDRPLPPTRGNILAADGQMLAASLPEYKMFMDFMSWEKHPKRRAKDQARRDSLLDCKMDSICEGMHRLFPDIDPQEFRRHLREGRRKEGHHWPLYPRRVTYIQYREVKKLPLFRYSSNWGGFHVEEYKTRKNPFGRLAIRTIGDLYKGKDSARCGLELSFDSVLRGKPGTFHYQKVMHKKLPIIDRPAEDGCDVQTTIDINMQDVCEKALRDKLVEINANSGVCILMEVATGDIKAMVSLKKLEEGVYQEVNAAAVSNLYEPGSVFKPMSFLVAMDDGYITMDDYVDVGGGIMEMHKRQMRDHNWRSGGYGRLTVPQILQKSSNIGVSVLIDRHYGKNPGKFVDGLYRIGVAEDLKLPIPGYARPRIRKPLPDKSNWSNTALPWMSIGYETQIPPISTLNFYNGIANNGKLMRPRLVKAILKNGEVVREFPVEVLRERMARPEAVKNIRTCLEQVVSIGLGKKAGSPLFHASGKTGTAQIWTRAGFASQYLVSFAGYYPSEKPLYSCIVCIQKGAPASGGLQCAPVFRRVAETVMAQHCVEDYSRARDTVKCKFPVVGAGNVRATQAVLSDLGMDYIADFDEDGTDPLWGEGASGSAGISLVRARRQDGTMPDMTGYGLRDAMFRLEKLGLRVKVSGVGRVVKQSLPPGHAIKRGERVELVLETEKDRRPKPRTDTLRTERPSTGAAGLPTEDDMEKKNRNN